ncbi:MAG: flagellar biosynthetic protein FliO [Acidobacteria bacterium]|nr:flagellar biosynthetic protein FliO [Acidobacteriota bacterium]MBI3663003.1 flagellar biosynthetic protein FliO [Acidobacteriota bacterium]
MPALVLRRRERRLSICELLPLGEKRFVAVVQVDRQQFLIGGAPNSVALLAQLPAGPPASAGGGNAGTGIS